MRQWTPTERQYARDHRADGAERVSAALGRTVAAVRQQWRKMGLGKHEFSHTADFQRQVRELHEQGVGTTLMAERLGASEWSVRRACKLLGLVPHRWTPQMRKLQADRMRRTNRKRRDQRYRCNDINRPLAGDNDRATGRTYADDEAEFLKVIAQFRQRHKRPPTHLEGFRIALGLGWGK